MRLSGNIYSYTLMFLRRLSQITDDIEMNYYAKVCVAILEVNLYDLPQGFTGQSAT